MKVALIVPGSRAGVSSERYRELFPHLLPMSIATLAGVLEKEGIEVLAIDQIARRLGNADLAALLGREQADVVGFSVLTNTATNVFETVPLVRAALPKAVVVMGNSHASIYADDILKRGLADVVVRGEGESSLLETVQALSAGKRLDKVLGISFVRQGKVVHNPARPVVEDLDAIPFPAWHLVDVFDPRYMALPLIGVFSTPLPVMGSRGCPFQCVFCTQDKLYKRVRLRKVTRIVDEIEACVDRFGFEWFGFNDAYFPWNRKQGHEFAEELIRRGLHKRCRWITENRVDQVDEELLKKLRESGLSVIFYGFESGNQRVLDLTGKGTTLAQAEAAARAAHNAGIRIMGFFMLGLPGETVESCWDTVNFAIRLDCDFAKFAITVPYPGSKLFEDVKGRIDLTQHEKFTSWYNWASGDEELLYAPDGMTPRELLSVQRLGMLKFYARPSQVYRHLVKGTLRVRDLATGGMVLAEGAAQEAAAKVREMLR